METKPTDAQVHRTTVNLERVEQLGYELLLALGQDPETEGLRETPRRWAKFWREFIEYDAGKTATTFSHSTKGEELVVVRDMRVWSLCEHHLLPFWCDITVGYVPRSKVLGLSKFARIANQFAHALQTQERLVSDIAGAVGDALNHSDIIVVGRGEHLCMTMRGIETPAIMTTINGRGVFDVSPRSHMTVRKDPYYLDLFWKAIG